jgi:hypothetical protein
VRRVIGFLLALGLTLGGVLWLLLQLFATGRISGNLIGAACVMFAVGAYWLWVDYIRPNRQG